MFKFELFLRFQIVTVQSFLLLYDTMIHAYIHACIHIYIHTYIHAYIHTFSNTYN